MTGSLVTRNELHSYELELSDLTVAELGYLKAQYETDDDRADGDSRTSAISLSDKTPMQPAIVKAALAKVKRDAEEKAKVIEAARRFRLEVYAGRETPRPPSHGERYGRRIRHSSKTVVAPPCAAAKTP